MVFGFAARDSGLSIAKFSNFVIDTDYGPKIS